METRTTESNAIGSKKQQVLALRTRVLNAQTAFLGLGYKQYTPHVISWAARNGVRLPSDAGERIRKCMSGNVRVSDALLIDAIEATVNSLRKAA